MDIDLVKRSILIGGSSVESLPQKFPQFKVSAASAWQLFSTSDGLNRSNRVYEAVTSNHKYNKSLSTLYTDWCPILRTFCRFSSFKLPIYFLSLKRWSSHRPRKGTWTELNFSTWNHDLACLIIALHWELWRLGGETFVFQKLPQPSLAVPSYVLHGPTSTLPGLLVSEAEESRWPMIALLAHGIKKKKRASSSYLRTVCRQVCCTSKTFGSTYKRIVVTNEKTWTTSRFGLLVASIRIWAWSWIITRGR